MTITMTQLAHIYPTGTTVRVRPKVADLGGSRGVVVRVGQQLGWTVVVVRLPGKQVALAPEEVERYG